MDNPTSLCVQRKLKKETRILKILIPGLVPTAMNKPAKTFAPKQKPFIAN
jgi:hypothetical protein